MGKGLPDGKNIRMASRNRLINCTEKAKCIFLRVHTHIFSDCRNENENKTCHDSHDAGSG